MEKIKKAIIMANITAILLAIIKLVTGILTGSLAVLSSALDSILDFFISLFNLYILKKSEKNFDDTYNYGQGKIQGLGAFFEGGVVAFSGIVLLYFGVQKIVGEVHIQQLDISIYMMIVSILLTGALVMYLSRVARLEKHLTLKSDILHYKTDLFTNIGIIVGLILIKLTGLYIIDAIIGILMGAYILFSSREIIVEGYHMLMDRKIDDEEIQKIIHIIQNTDTQVTGYHFLKTRQSGNDIFIDFHLVFNKEIKLLDAHMIGDKIEHQIHQIIPNSFISVHLDPFDDSSRESCRI